MTIYKHLFNPYLSILIVLSKSRETVTKVPMSDCSQLQFSKSVCLSCPFKELKTSLFISIGLEGLLFSPVNSPWYSITAGGYDGFSHLRTVECFQPPPSHADPPIARVSQSPADTCLGRRSRSSNETAMQGDSSNRGWMRCTANTSQSNAQRDTLSRPTSSDEEASSGSTQSSSTNTATSLEPTVSCLEVSVHIIFRYHCPHRLEW